MTVLKYSVSRGLSRGSWFMIRVLLTEDLDVVRQHLDDCDCEPWQG